MDNNLIVQVQDQVLFLNKGSFGNSLGKEGNDLLHCSFYPVKAFQQEKKNGRRQRRGGEDIYVALPPRCCLGIFASYWQKVPRQRDDTIKAYFDYRY